MNTENLYEPTGDFRDRLEAEVLRSFRRAELRTVRAGVGVPSARWARAAVIAFVSLAIGTTAGLASAQMRRSGERDSLLAAARADAMVASLRRDLARAQADDVTRKVHLGLAGAQESARATTELQRAEMEFTRDALNIQEITASGRAPRDDLSAPLVDGRDFVKERLELEAMAAQKALGVAVEAQTGVERRVRAGVDTDLERLAGALEIAKARAAFVVLATKVQLRKQYLQQNTDIERLTRLAEKTQLQQDVLVAQQALNLANARLALVERQRQAGVVDEVQRLRAELDVKERQLELQRLAVQLQALR